METLTNLSSEVAEGPPTKRPLRVPHVITDVAEVHAAAAKLLQGEAFCVDVETREHQDGFPNPRTNEITWIGLGGMGQVYLIPMGHPKGITLIPEHRAKRTLIEIYGLDDPRVMTKGGKISAASKEVTIPAVFANPPRQLYPSEVFEALRPLLFSNLFKVGHNVKFDMQSIAKYYGGVTPPGPYHDTIILKHVLDESLDDYSLKTLTCDWLRIPVYRRAKFYPNLGKAGVDRFGLDQVARYLTKDIHYCWSLFNLWSTRLRRKKLQHVYDFEMELYPVLIDIEQGGFTVDQSQLANVRQELMDRIAKVEQEAWVIAGDTFSLSHTDTKRWVMFGEGKPAFGTVIDKDSDSYGKSTRRKLGTQGLRVLSRTTETRVPQVTQAVLEAYADRGNRMAELFLEWSLMEKLRGTFVEGIGALLTFHDGDPMPRIHTGFKQHGTVTGRLSSARPNLQQLPRGSTIRDLFVAGPGRVLIVADYDQIELRCTAEQSGDRVMTQVFMDGRDIHAQATAAALRIPVEKVTPELRQVGKTLNFATLYGAAEGKIAAVAGGSVQRGREFLDRYYAQFSGLKPWKARVLRDARAYGDRSDFAVNPPAVLIPPLGRLRRLPDLYEREEWKRWRAERQAINAVIQGYASYITKMAMMRLHPILKEFPARMVVQVHDEIVVSVDERYVSEVQPLVVSTMGDIRGTDGEPILGRIPLLASAGVGYSWASAKGK